MTQNNYAGANAQFGIKRLQHETPRVKVVQFVVECGYSGSYTQKLGLSEDLGDINLERRSNTGGNWGSATDEHWY